MGTLGVILGTILLAIAAAVVVVFLIVPLAKIFVKAIGHVFATIGRWVTDIFRLIGTVLVIPVFMLLTVLSVVIGRWSASAHYGRAVSGEIKSAALCVYRIAIGHPLRLIGLHVLVEGFERRLPEVVAAAPGRDKPRGRKNQFDGYTVVGSLAGGGSGGKLYIAQPDELKHAAFIKRGIGDVEQVVIKTFSVHEGSTLPQIIRESRALDAAKRLGLILEHDLTNERFFYVMRYIPGDPLSIVTQRAHAEAGPEGLSDQTLAKLLGLGRDVLLTLNRYHTGGLWHKDIKPDNIIVDHDRAHVVDLGLITPLRSAMTLTTHGTEYFRDPELVRMALKGVKVNEVNGEKFDIYAAAAVMYAMIEGSFPAHGGLSQITKRCPESIRWIIRRGMTDYDKRYDSVADMLTDLDVVLTAESPFDVKPAMLPSVSGEATHLDPEHAEPVDLLGDAAPHAPNPGPAHNPAHNPGPAPKAKSDPEPKRQPKVKVANWWSGRYAIDDELNQAVDNVMQEVNTAMEEAMGAVKRHTPAPKAAKRTNRDPSRRPAHEQLQNARARAAERRLRAASRIKERRRNLKATKQKATGMNPGMAIAIGCVVGLISIPLSITLLQSNEPGSTAFAVAEAPGAPTAPLPMPMPAAAPHADAIVLSTFRAPIDDAIRDQINSAVDNLRAHGFSTADNVHSDGAEHLDLFADLRRARDLAPESLDAAAIEISNWFKHHADDYDVVILLEPDPVAAARGESAARIIVADDDSASTASQGHLHELASIATRVIKD